MPDLKQASRSVVRVFDRVVGSAHYVAAALIAILLVLTCAEVAHRLIRGGSLRGVIELAEVMLVPVVYLAVASAERADVHVSTRVLIDRVPRRTADMLYRVAMVPVLVIFVWMSWELADRALSSFASGEYRFGLARVPIWPGRAVLFISIVILSLELLRSVWRGTAERPGPPAAGDGSRHVAGL